MTKKEPKLKPEFIEKIKQIEKQKSIPVNDFSKKYKI
jgi:hypothetical protein